jgi:Rod binding domain-containing protein
MPGPLSPPNPHLGAAASPRTLATGKAGAAEPDPALRSACEGMEALFITHMLSEMRKTVPKSDFLGGGRAEEIYTSLMDAERAKQMAGAGGLGLSSVLLEQLGGGGAAPGKPPRP